MTQSITRENEGLLTAIRACTDVYTSGIPSYFTSTFSSRKVIDLLADESLDDDKPEKLKELLMEVTVGTESVRGCLQHGRLISQLKVLPV